MNIMTQSQTLRATITRLQTRLAELEAKETRLRESRPEIPDLDRREVLILMRSLLAEDGSGWTQKTTTDILELLDIPARFHTPRLQGQLRRILEAANYVWISSRYKGKVQRRWRRKWDFDSAPCRMLPDGLNETPERIGLDDVQPTESEGVTLE